MKFRVALASIFLTVAAILMLHQVNLARAESPTNRGSIGDPITSPIRYFPLSGKVTYRMPHILGLSTQDHPCANLSCEPNVSPTQPAKDVTMTATNARTHQVFTTQTNEQGKYVFSLPTGRYELRPSDSYGTTFRPEVRHFNLFTHGASHVNFQGIR